jgi:hypothetical protein
MRMSAVLLLAIAAVAALPQAARAKEVSKVEICGASGCETLPRDRATVDAFMEGGMPADPPSRAAAWYAIRYTISPGEGEEIKSFTFRNAYVPSANRLRERGEGGGFAWFEPYGEFVRAVRPALRRVTAYPASRLRGLDGGAVQARVAEEVGAAPDRAPVALVAPAGSKPWGWIAIAVFAGAVLVAVCAARGRRRRSSVHGSVATCAARAATRDSALRRPRAR